MPPSSNRFIRVAGFCAVFAVFLAAAACSSYALAEPKVPPIAAFGPGARTDVATVCVIRPSHMAVAVTFAVHDNRQLVGATRGESYFCYWAEPGRHRIVSTTGDSTDRDGDALLTAEAGKRYFLHQDYDSVFGVIVDKLQWVDEPRARELLDDGKCDYMTLSGVPGEEALPAAVPLARAAGATQASAR
jgi:hypothetical protein